MRINIHAKSQMRFFTWRTYSAFVEMDAPLGLREPPRTWSTGSL